LYHIGEVSLIAVVVNVLVLPVVPIAMLATFLTGVSALVVPLLMIPFSIIAHGVLTYIIAVATFFAAIPFASIAITTFTLLEVYLLYGTIIIALLWLHYRRSHSTTLTAGWTIEEEKELPDSDSSVPLVSSR
jgi:competence protein ComEC